MADRKPLIGLLVLNWNGAEVLPLCLSSLSAAAAACAWETRLLLVDNASTDGSAESAGREHPEWELLQSETNLGFAGGMNLGLAKLLDDGADYVCVINNDVEADAGLLTPLLEDLEQEARRGAACPRIHYFEPRERIWYAGGKVGRLTLVSRHLGIRRRAEGRWLRAADTGYLTGCCLMAKAEFWRTTGGFDEEFGLYAEDVDLSLRARALGWELRYLPDALLYHRVGFSSGGGGSPRKLRAQRRAVGQLLRRHRSPLQRPLAWLAWLLFAGGRAVAALFRGEAGLPVSLLRSLAPEANRKAKNERQD